MRDPEYPRRLRGQAPVGRSRDEPARKPTPTHDDPRRMSLGVPGTYWKQPIRYE